MGALDINRNESWIARGVGAAIGVAAALGCAGCASGEDSRMTLGAMTLQVMTSDMGQDTGDTPADDDGNGNDNDNNNDADDDDDNDGVASTGSDGGADTTGGAAQDTGDASDSSDDGGPTSSLLLHFNTEGVFLSAGQEDNAPNWESMLVTESQEIAAYADAGRASQIQDALKSIVADYPFDIVSEDPGIDAEYTMVVLIELSPVVLGLPLSVVAIGPSDCGNENLNNVILAFDWSGQNNSVDTLANAIAFALGTVSGLNSNEADGDAMNEAAVAQVVSFTDQCVAVADKVCPIMPAGLCDAGEQNSHEALQAAFPR